MPSPAPNDTDHPTTRSPERERQCVACRAMRPRTELLRVGRLPDGTVTIGSPAQAPGRGAYLCRTEACYTQARKYRKLEKALRTGVSPSVWAQVEAILGPEGGAEAAI